MSNQISIDQRTVVGLLFLFIATTGPVVATEEAEFRNSLVGFQITKPDDWFYGSAEQHRENLESIRVGTPEFQEAMLRYARTPLVTIMRYEHVDAGLNPMLKVNIRPFGKFQSMGVQGVMEVLMDSYAEQMDQFELIEQPKSIAISGIDSVYAVFEYRLTQLDGSAERARSHLWLIPRDDQMFFIGVGYSSGDSELVAQDISSMIKSVVISDPPSKVNR